MSYRSIGSIALLLLLPRQAMSAEPGPQDLKRLSIEQLMQIDVTLAARRPKPIATAPTAISVVTGDDIRRAGVIDGRTVYSPLFTGVFWNALDYELEDIDRIEVVRGPGATLWGANAVNGVINIVTRSSRDTPGLFVQAGSGNEDPADAEVRYGGVAGSATYRAYAKYVVRDSQRFSTGASAGDHRERAQAGARFDGGSPAGGAWMLKADVFHSIDGLPGRPNGEFTIGDLHAAGSRDVGGLTTEANDPRHVFTLRTSVDLSQRVELDARWRSIGELPHPRVPAYSEAAARLGWRASAHVDLALVGEDLLHPQHAEFNPVAAGFELFQRSIRAVFTARF